MRVKHAVYLNADKTIAVPEGDKRARWVLCGPGMRVLDDVAKKYGITENGAPEQKEAEAPIIAPELVNANCPDGVNTHPGSPAAISTLPSVAARLSARTPEGGADNAAAVVPVTAADPEDPAPVVLEGIRAEPLKSKPARRVPRGRR